jgi:hypothetical protein
MSLRPRFAAIAISFSALLGVTAATAATVAPAAVAAAPAAHVSPNDTWT